MENFEKYRESGQCLPIGKGTTTKRPGISHEKEGRAYTNLGEEAKPLPSQNEKNEKKSTRGKKKRTVCRLSVSARREMKVSYRGEKDGDVGIFWEKRQKKPSHRFGSWPE